MSVKNVQKIKTLSFYYLLNSISDCGICNLIHFFSRCNSIYFRECYFNRYRGKRPVYWFNGYFFPTISWCSGHTGYNHSDSFVNKEN